jgi:hypothetical protein
MCPNAFILDQYVVENKSFCFSRADILRMVVIVRFGPHSLAAALSKVFTEPDHGVDSRSVVVRNGTLETDASGLI